MDRHRAWLQPHLNAATSKLVRPTTGQLHRGMRGWQLRNLTDESRQRHIQNVSRWRCCMEYIFEWPFGIVGRAAFSEQECGAIGLWHSLNVLNQSSCLSHADYQNTGC